MTCEVSSLFFYTVKDTFFKNWCLFGEREALDFLMESSMISVELLFQLLASYFPFTTRPLQGTLDQSGSSQKIKIRQ